MPDPLARGLELPVPILLGASVVVVSVIGLVSAPLRRALMLIPYRVRTSGQVYRLLTAGWVHASVTHLLFNMLTLYFFADGVMRVLGPTRFLVLYVSAVIMAFVPTTLGQMSNPRYASLGASGAVAAVMFSAILLQPKLQLYLMFLPIPVPGIVFAIGYLAYSAWQARGGRDDVNHIAHFAGAFYGALLTFAFEPARVERTLRTFF